MKGDKGFKFSDITETIRIKDNGVKCNILTVSGKDGDFFVMVSPSLLVSGYGDSEEQAFQSFRENIELFCNDLLSLSREKRDIELKNLGFSRGKFQTKNFSKAYVDENGVLQNLDPKTKSVKMLEAAI